MDFVTKSRFIRGDSATLVRYFDHQFKVFLVMLYLVNVSHLVMLQTTSGERSLQLVVQYMSIGLHTLRMLLCIVRFQMRK